MPLNSDINFESNLTSSVEAFIYTNVVVPYNAAVASLNFPTPLSIIMAKPDDPAVVVNPPVIAMEQPIDCSGPTSLGMGDRMVWQYKLVRFNCYPALSSEGAVTKPSITATGYLRSLFNNISTALTIPLSDFTTDPATLMDGAYIDSGKISEIRGAASMLAIDKHRFIFELRLRYNLVTLNG